MLTQISVPGEADAFDVPGDADPVPEFPPPPPGVIVGVGPGGVVGAEGSSWHWSDELLSDA
jgi:hypothetical protein